MHLKKISRYEGEAEAGAEAEAEAEAEATVHIGTEATKTTIPMEAVVVAEGLTKGTDTVSQSRSHRSNMFRLGFLESPNNKDLLLVRVSLGTHSSYGLALSLS